MPRLPSPMRLVAVLSAATIAGATLVASPLFARTARGAQQPREAAAQTPSVRVAGLLVNTPLRQSGEDTEELAFVGTFARTSLALELVVPQGGLVALDCDRSKVALFSDDQGTDLTDAHDFFGPIERLPRVAPDGRSLVFVLSSRTPPGRRASRLHAEGELVVRMSSERSTLASQPVALVKGSSFQVGDLRFEVTESGPSPWGEGWSTTVLTRQDPSAIVSWSLVGPDGEEHAWQDIASWDGGGTWYRSLATDERIEHATVRIEAWKDVREGRIPFEVETGLGLQ